MTASVYSWALVGRERPPSSPPVTVTSPVSNPVTSSDHVNVHAERRGRVDRRRHTADSRPQAPAASPGRRRHHRRGRTRVGPVRRRVGGHRHHPRRQKAPSASPPACTPWCSSPVNVPLRPHPSPSRRRSRKPLTSSDHVNVTLRSLVELKLRRHPRRSPPSAPYCRTASAADRPAAA